MTTVASRTLRSIPHRGAVLTWETIVELLTQGNRDDTYGELMAVTGIAASLITDHSPQNSPIVVTCDGPRTRIYCIYGEDAIDGSGANENVLGFDPLKGDWRVSLPCTADDLSWVQEALKKHSSRIIARNLEAGLSEDNKAVAAKAGSLILNPEGFLKP